MKLQKLLTAIILSLSVSLSFAQKDNVPIGARSSAMSGASATLIDFWAVHNNQAAMASYTKIAVGVYYENRFLTKQLGLKCISFVLPIKKAGVVGFNYSNFGYALYNESKIGLAYAKSFGKRIAAGVQLDYIYTRIGENYGHKGVVTFEAGLRAKIIKNLVLAAHIYNPINIKIADYGNERIPLIFKIGLAYSFAEKAVLAIEVEKDNNFHPIFKTGFEYHITKHIFLRMGIATNPMTYSFGTGFEFSKFKLDISASYHQVLGFSPQASLVYDIH
ncbi:MAG: hypothetical protein WCQ95_07810 [Bacteroidota bacterium]